MSHPSAAALNTGRCWLLLLTRMALVPNVARASSAARSRARPPPFTRKFFCLPRLPALCATLRRGDAPACFWVMCWTPCGLCAHGQGIVLEPRSFSRVRGSREPCTAVGTRMTLVEGMPR